MPTPTHNAGAERSAPPVERSVTEQKLAEERLRRHVQFLTQVQASTVELLDRQDQASLLQAIVNRAEAMFGAQGATLALLDGADLISRACTPRTVFLLGRRLDRSQPLLSWRVIDTREPIAVEDYSSHPDRVRSPGSMFLKACAIFPIMNGDVVVGTLGISRCVPGNIFTADEMQMGRLFTQIVALLLRNAGIYDEAVRLAEARTAALRESEGKFRGVFDHSPMIICLLTLQPEPDGGHHGTGSHRGTARPPGGLAA